MVDDEYLLYALSDTGLFVADKRTGRLLQYFDPGNGISSPPVLAGQDLYVLSNGGVLYAFHVESFRS